MVILTILKVIGIVLLIILGIVLLALLAVLFVPVRYAAIFETEDKVRVNYRVSWFLRAVQYKKGISSSKPKLYIFGIDVAAVKSWFRRKMGREDEVYEDIHVENSDVGLVDDYHEEAENHEEKVSNFSVESDYDDERLSDDDEIDPELGYEEKIPKEGFMKKAKRAGKNAKKAKKNFSFDKISSIIKMLKDSGNQRVFDKVKKEFIGIVKYILPYKISGRFNVGTGDPCTTGWIIGAVGLTPIAYMDGVKIEPDFEEKVFTADGFVKGRMRVIFFLRVIIRCYRDEEMMRTYREFRDVL
ncbi:MAG: DUF2953 domain-containing protein [Eubacterium sp.]|nr:DUF2953 domain-containing protein [Eubacterium sp.]